MGHNHGHSHSSYHVYHHYSHRYNDAPLSFYVVAIVLAILFACVANSCSVAQAEKAWNNGKCLSCGRFYQYSVCDECGEIETFWCKHCDFKYEVPEGISLDYTRR